MSLLSCFLQEGAEEEVDISLKFHGDVLVVEVLAGLWHKKSVIRIITVAWEEMETSSEVHANNGASWGVKLQEMGTTQQKLCFSYLLC